MTRQNFTSLLVKSFQCFSGKKQCIFYDAKAPGLGLRVTDTNKKSYIFETKLHGKTLRITIGDAKAWSLSEAQTEATRLTVMTDQGLDPRQVLAERQAKASATTQRTKLECLTLGEVWIEYVETRKPHWSERHYKDHLSMIHTGGQPRTRNANLTVPGLLASLLNTRLTDLTTECINQWATNESDKRPTQARLALRLLRAFLNWCTEHQIYKDIVTTNAAKNKSIRETLGKPKVKNDVLQKEQLPAWFKAVKQIQNPVISAYLQSLLLTGARREEMAHLRWEDIDFQWNSLTIHDKVDDFRIIPLTPYVAHLLDNLPRRNEWVFSSPTAASGRLTEPRLAHNQACVIAGLVLTLHGLRRSFASLCEWTETPAGIAAQIQGHKPQGVREQNYIRRPLDLLRMWHVKIEGWILEHAGIEFVSTQTGLKVVEK